VDTGGGGVWSDDPSDDSGSDSVGPPAEAVGGGRGSIASSDPDSDSQGGEALTAGVHGFEPYAGSGSMPAQQADIAAFSYTASAPMTFDGADDADAPPLDDDGLSGAGPPGV